MRLLGWMSLCIVITIQGCGKDISGPCLVEKNAINQDQRGTFMSRQTQFPAHIIADSGFSSKEQAAISSAVSKWNFAGQAFAGHDFFEKSAQGIVPSWVRSVNLKDCTQEVGSINGFYIISETDAKRWRDLGFADNVPGVTIRCDRDGQLVRQVIYINRSIIDPHQFESVILHELGHALGLDHSCSDKSDSEDFIGCQKVTANHPYQEAVMFPSLRAWSPSSHELPELKENLQQNDLDRTQCRYSPK